MKNTLNGKTRPDLIKMSHKDKKQGKTKTYKTPSGEKFVITEDEFSKVVEIFDYLRKIREKKDTQLDTLELERGKQSGDIELDKEAG